VNLNDRVGDWVLRRIVSPLLWKIAETLSLGFDDPDPLKEHAYLVTAEHGISLSAYPDKVEKGEVIIITRDLGDILSREGSVMRLDESDALIAQFYRSVRYRMQK